MRQHFPKQILHHIAVAMFVRMWKSVAAWRHCSPDRRELRAVVAESVTDVIESYCMCQLRKHKTDNMAPRGESPSSLVYSMLVGKFFRQMRRDEFTKLMQCAAVMFGRRDCFHSSDSLVGIRRRPPFLSYLANVISYILWDDCDSAAYMPPLLGDCSNRSFSA